VVDGSSDRREVVIGSELDKQATALRSILHRVFPLRKAQLDASLRQIMVESRKS